MPPGSGDFSCERLNEHVHLLREGRTALNVVVADETKDPPLGEHCPVIVDRTVAKAEEKARMSLPQLQVCVASPC